MDFFFIISFLVCIAARVTGHVARDNVACYFWDDAIHHAGHCYKLFKQDRVSKTQAELACAAQTSGGMLAEVISETQLVGLVDLAREEEVSVFLAPFVTAETSPDFHNPSDPKSPVKIPDYLWGRGEPELPTHSDPHCLMIDSKGELEAEQCDEERLDGFICQQEADDVCQLFQPGSVYFQGNCYHYQKKTLNYTNAQVACTQKKSFPAEPTTLDQYNFVRGYAAQYPGSEWVGGQARQEHNYTMTWWMAGVPVTDNATVWGSDPGQESYRQMVMSDQHDDKFKTAPDYKTFSAICQTDPGNPCEWFYPGSVYGDGRCFKVHTKQLSWQDAKILIMREWSINVDVIINHHQKSCSKEASVLADLSSDIAFHTVSQLIMYTTKSDLNTVPVFIGLSYDSVKSAFRWSDSGLPLMSPRWAEGQPNQTTSTQAYVAYRPEAFDWIVLDDLSIGCYVCQKDVKAPSKQRFNIPVPDLTTYRGKRYQQVYVEVLTRITSHWVYVLWQGNSPSVSAASRYRLNQGKVLRFDIPREFFSDQCGVNNRRYRITTFHPVSVTIYYVIDGIPAAALWPTSIYTKIPPVSYLVSTSGFSTNSHDIVESHVSIQTMVKPVHVTLRFPGHVSGAVLINLGGLEMTVTGDIEFDLAFLQTAVVRLIGNIDGLFIYTTHMVMVMVASVMKYPLVTGGLAHVISPVLPSLLTSEYYVTFPSVVSDVMEQKYFVDYFTVINLADDNEIKVIHQGKVSTVLPMPQFGQTTTFQPPIEAFCVVKAPLPFYLIKNTHWTDGKTARNPCRTDILPKRLWRKEYSVTMTPDPGLREVSLYLIVSDLYIADIVIDGVLTNASSCSKIEGSYQFGCSIDITDLVLQDEGTPHHINIHDFPDSFGAYVMVTSDDAIRCQSLGIVNAIAPKQPLISLDSVYQPPLIPTTTTTTTISHPTTLSLSTSSATQSSSATMPTTSTAPLITFPTWLSATTTPNRQLPPLSLYLNMTEQERLQLLYDIEESLKIDARSTSAFKRRKTSADDVRTTSTAIGLVGVAVMVVIFGFILCSDVISAANTIYYYFLNSGCARRASASPTSRNSRRQ